MWEQHIMGILYQNYGEMADLALSLKGLTAKLKKLIKLLFFLENESRYLDSVGVNRESLI